jgi:hypothetical protein
MTIAYLKCEDHLVFFLYRHSFRVFGFKDRKSESHALRVIAMIIRGH